MTLAPVVFGIHAVSAVLKTRAHTVKKLYLLKTRQDPSSDALIALAAAHQTPVSWVSRDELERIAHDRHHQGAVAVCQATPSWNEGDLTTFLGQLKEPPLLIVLDGVQDPRNLGACLRSADAFGAHAVIVPKDRAASMTATTYKAASGAAERVPVFTVTNLARTLRLLKEQDIQLVGAHLSGEKTLHEITLNKPLAIILGSEEKGMRRLTREHCDVLVTIPLRESCESLNVSVACGIFLYEIRRARIQSPSA